MSSIGGPILDKHLSKDRFPIQSAARHDKLEKLEEHIIKIIFHVIINAVHYYVIKDAKFLHWSFGGKYDDLQFFENYPCLDLPEYHFDVYLVILSFYIFELIHHLLCNRHRNDFAEMTLHHFITTVLILFSYTTNQVTMGSFVILCNGVSDIWCNNMKIVYEYCNAKWQYFWYVVMFVIFSYARAVVVPFVASP